VVRRKAAVVAAVRAGMITVEEACRRYQLSEEEFVSWQRAFVVPGFEFNSLRRWLSPEQFEDVFPRAEHVGGPAECFGFGDPDENP
jgi:hypothetical protein